jgi:hypothetical protein
VGAHNNALATRLVSAVQCGPELRHSEQEPGADRSHVGEATIDLVFWPVVATCAILDLAHSWQKVTIACGICKVKTHLSQQLFLTT